MVIPQPELKMLKTDAPSAEIKRASAAIDEMRVSADLDVYEENWKEYLRRIERSFNKVQAYYSKSPKYSGWIGKYTKLRKDDPLLRYLTNARGADEHTVADISARSAGGVAFNPPAGSNTLVLKNFRISEGVIYADAPNGVSISFIPEKVRLLAVKNRGVIYDVPHSHLGEAVDPFDVVGVAEYGLKFYSSVISEAEAFFVN